MTEPRCRRCGGRIGLTRGMVACLPDQGDPCTPVCRHCGRDLVPDDTLPADRGSNHWQRACGCVLEPEPDRDYGFTEEDIASIQGLLAARDFEAPADFARHLLDSLAETGTWVVLSLPEGDIVITAEDAAAAIGRQLPD